MKRGQFFFVLLAGLMILSCATQHRVLVVYDRTEGLKSGDRIFLENQPIGSVGNLEKNSQGRTVVTLQIKDDFQKNVTDQSRFLIQDDPNRPGSGSVKIVTLAPGGKILPDGAVVDGSTTFSFMLEKGAFTFQGWAKLFQDTIDRLEKEVRRLSDKEWQKELEQQMEGWTRELERSGEEMRRYFQKEVLPRLEENIRDFRRRLKQQGKEKDGETLEEKLEDLKRTLQS